MQNQENNTSQEGYSESSAVQTFVRRLSPEEHMLVLLQAELYKGSWQSMLEDLRNRLEGRPFIFKLANRIRDDIDRIEKLMAFEKEHEVRLSDYVQPPNHSVEQSG